MTGGTMLVLGGARSGKSAYAERVVLESGWEPVYIATAQPGDAEMAARIAHHRARRRGNWQTVEEPQRLEEALAGVAGEGRAVLVDCLTLWLSNLMLAGADCEARGKQLRDCIRHTPGLLILVSNEVGLGLVPETALGRAFRDAQGRLNQALAEAADRVVFIAAGLPIFLKGTPVSHKP